MRQEVLNSVGDVVSALQQGLAATIGRDRFDLWFGTQVHWSWSANTVVLTAPNTFHLDRLKRQFARELQRTVQTICGHSARAEFRVEEPLTNPDIREVITATPVTAAPVLSVEPNSATASELTAGTAKEGGATVGNSAVDQKSPGGAAAPSPSTAGRPTASVRRVSAPGSNPVVERASLATFVVGEGNRIAYTATESMIRRPGMVSPLFVYGPAGCGKTHLLESACTAMRAQLQRSGRGAIRALLLTAEQFTSLFLEALQGSGLPNFRRKCRDVDLLAIDDIQFFARKPATLLEFQHTMDTLARNGHQLIVAADRPPGELASLGPELVGRLTGGLVCSMEPADFETRIGIVRRFVERAQLSVPEDVMQLIAQETSGDARQIRGALNRLRATSEAERLPISLSMAQRALADMFAATQRLVRLPDVERAVCEVFGMESRALRDGTKTKSVSHPRMLAMWLARKYTRAAFSEIGEFFGRRSHSTVISAERKVTRWVADGAKLQLGRTSWTVDEAIRRIELKLRTG